MRAGIGPRRRVTHRHEVSSAHDRYTHQILARIEEDSPVTQRTLARELGIALGLTNLLIHRLVKKGYVRLASIDRQRMRYFITPEGAAEKARMSKAFLENTLHLYTETRQRIRSSLDRLSSEWNDADAAASGCAEKKVVFYGAGDVAEIAYVSLQGSDLRLVGVVDDKSAAVFFGLPVHPPARLTTSGLDGERFGRVIVTSVRHADAIQERLQSIGLDENRLFFL